MKTMKSYRAMIAVVGLLFFASATALAQDSRTWSLQAGVGEINMLENKYDDGNLFVSEDQGNSFYLSADYWQSERFALTGGLTLEQQGLYTDYSDGIGLKKVNMLGVNVGVKYYFFPKKWIFLPHIGASVYTNILNLGHQRGETEVCLDQGHPGTHGVLNYDVQCPGISLSPRIGADIRLFSTVSLCID